MRGLQWFLVSAFICVQVKYSLSTVQETFGLCATDSDCPDNADCIDLSGTPVCRCNSGFDAIDLPFTSDGTTVTVCVDLGPCTPFDRVTSDCGANGQCVTYTQSGVTMAYCKCINGYTGLNCNTQGPYTNNPYYTTRSPYYTTRRPGNIGGILPIIGGGAALLILLAAGGAALASSAG